MSARRMSGLGYTDDEKEMMSQEIFRLFEEVSGLALAQNQNVSLGKISDRMADRAGRSVQSKNIDGGVLNSRLIEQRNDFVIAKRVAVSAQPQEGDSDFVGPVQTWSPIPDWLRQAIALPAEKEADKQGVASPKYRYPISPDPAYDASLSSPVKQLTTPAPGKTQPKQFWGTDLLNVVNTLFGGWSEVEKINMQRQLVAAQQQGKGISFTPQQKSAVDKYLVWGGFGLAGLAVAGLLVWVLTKK